MITLICGITPDDLTLRRKMPPYMASDTTPSWMRAPAPSFSPMKGAPTRAAMSMTLCTFSANTSPSAPPNTVKSCAKRNTLRPSIVPQPVMTPSVKGVSSSSGLRLRASRSSSTKLPSSSRYSTRSRAVSLPRSCCRWTARSDPAWYASSLRFSSCSRRSLSGCSIEP